MQDIRKPYNRSRSSTGDLSSRVEEFESRSYPEEESNGPVVTHIPIKRTRRDVSSMEMFPTRRHDDDPDEPIPARRASTDGIYRDPRTRYRTQDSHIGTWAFIGTIVVLVVGAVLLTYVFNRATVTILPKHQNIEVNQTYTFTTTESEGNVRFILATSTISKTKSLPLSETKKVQSKASGKIVIYNKFDASPQKLIKNTRFESASGKIYRINESITVPGMKGSTPGSVEATVYADSYGTEYNSAATDFTIPGFKGSPRYTAFFAHSDGPLTGGASGDVSLASLSDINAAKDELALELAQEVKTNLLKVKQDGYTGLYSAISVQYHDNEDAILQGVSSTYEVTATGYLMLADTAELATTLAHQVRDYNGGPVKLGYADTLMYTTKDTAHLDTDQSIDVLVAGKPQIIWTTTEDSIKKLLAGKPRSDFNAQMRTIDSIEQGEISFSPLWLSTFPTDLQKITVVEKLPVR
jgi:hypothetical protein